MKYSFLAACGAVTLASAMTLSAHANHQVRISGTVAGGMDHGNLAPAAKAGDKPMARPGDAKPGMAADHMGGDKKSATLTATSVTMISATCTTTSQQ